MSNDNKFLDAALMYHSLGYSVIPLRPGEKKPLSAWKEYQIRRATPKQIRQWWAKTPNANVGIVTGDVSGIIALDLDGPEAFDPLLEHGTLPDGPISRTSRGWHHLLKHPGRKIGNFAGKIENVDLRGDGGYIVAPPSIHPSGDTYRWQISPKDMELPDTPAWLYDLLFNEPDPERRPVRPETPQTRVSPNDASPNGQRYAEAALESEADTLARTTEGARNDQLNKAAFNLGQLVAGGYLTESDVERALWSACIENGLIQDDGRSAFSKTLQSGLQDGMKKCRHPPAPEPVGTFYTETRPAVQKRAIRPAVTPGENIPQASNEQISNALKNQEYGDAELLTYLYEGRLIYDHAEKCWLYWTGHAWHRDDKAMIKRLIPGQLAAQYLHCSADARREAQALAAQDRDDEAKAKEKFASALSKRADRLRRVRRVQRVLEFAQSFMPAAGNEWDGNPWLLGVRNGVINLKTGEHRPGQPEDYIRTVAPTVWKGLHEPAPRFEQFMYEILNNDEVVLFMQRLLGYGLTGLRREHVLPILWGKGRNGKDTLLETLSVVLGPAASAVSTEVLTDSGRRGGSATPHLYNLRGKRLVWASETNEGARLNAGQVKLVTGGGQIVARPLYGNEVRFNPSHLLLLITNNKPHAPADDYALWKRVLLIPFTQQFVADPDPDVDTEHKADIELGDKLQEEASGILAWLVRGCLEWQDEGLKPPATVRLATQEYQEEEDTLGLFLKETCIEKDDAKVKSSALYEEYNQWCNGKPMWRNTFGKKMQRRYERKRESDGYYYYGIGLLTSR